MRLRIDPAPPFTHCDAAFWQPCFSEGGRRALKQALLADFDVVPAPSDEICDGQAAKPDQLKRLAMPYVIAAMIAQGIIGISNARGNTMQSPSRFWVMTT